MVRSLAGSQQKTPGNDKGHDNTDFVAGLRISGITQHVTQNIQARCPSANDDHTVRHQG
jgi:hypothetical protein